jgi:hypothetical protein
MLRDLCWLAVGIALALGWFLEHRRHLASDRAWTQALSEQSERFTADLQSLREAQQALEERVAAKPPTVAQPKIPPLLARLRAVWRDDVSKREAFQAYREWLGQQLFDDERTSVFESTGPVAFARVDSTLTPAERRTLILFGNLDRLREQTKLYEVHNPGTIGNGFSAYMTPEGELVFLWIIPEG